MVVSLDITPGVVVPDGVEFGDAFSVAAVSVPAVFKAGVVISTVLWL